MAFDLEEIRQSTDPSVLEGVQGAQEPQPAQEQAEPAVAPQGGTIDIPKEGIGPAVILEDESGRATLAPASGADGHMLSAKEARVRHEQSGLDYGSFLNAEQARRWQSENTSPEGRQGIRATLLTAKGIRPEQIARDKELAMRLGISPEQVHYAVETAEDEDFARQLEQFDRLAEFASRSPYHAAYARGFFDDLTKIEMEEAERHIAEREAKAQEWANPVAGAALKSMQMTFPNESSAKTIRGAIDRSRAQAVMSETADRLIAANAEGRTEDAERLRETLKMQSVALSQIGPEDEFDRSIASRIGLGYAFEQTHTSLPIMGKSLGIGAITGLGVVGAGAGIGALATGGPGAAAGARAALPKALKAGEAATIAASSYYTFYLERNLALPEILAMTDEAGHAMPLDIAIEAATAYGAVAAGLETVAEKAALGVFKPVSNLGRSGAARYIAKAIMADPGLRQGAQAIGRALGPTGRIALGKLWQLGVAGSAEAFTEATQAASEVTARSWAAKTANWRIEGERASNPSAPAGSFDERILTPENLKQIADEAKAGFAGGFWFGVLPAAASGVYHGVRVQSARTFADREIQRHAAVEQSPLTQLDPSAMSEYLQTVAPELEQEVMIPMDRAVTLHQQGIDIISPFGVSIEEAQRAAASGQALNVPLSELHSRLDATQFKAAADIMQRRQVDAMAEEAQTSDEDLLRRLAQPLDNAERIEAARNAESWMTPEQRAAYGQEIERLRKEMRIAIQGVPNVLAQAEAQGGLDAYLEGVIVPLRRAASMLARRTGQNPADVARKIIIDSARRAQQAQANATAEERAAADIEAEFSEPAQEEPAQAAQEAAPAQEQAAEAEPVQTAQEAAPAHETVLNEGPDELPPVPPEVQARWDAAEQASQAQEAPVQEQAQEVQPEAQAGQEVQAEELQAQAQEAPAEPVQANPRRAVGMVSEMYVPSGEDEQISYQVWELGDIVPSHDPTNNFARNKEYPETAQERPYHSDRGEREKVLRNYAEFKPRYLVTDNPDATTGPSIITPTGYVLGGNSRAMVIQLVYANGGERAEAYRKAVEDKAQSFGIDPAAVAAMNQPVLVRVLDRAMTPLEMAQASRRLNVSTTQALQIEAEGVSKSRLVSETTLNELGKTGAEFDTLREFLASTKSRKFVAGLIEDGVIETTQASRLTDAQTGLLNSEGKALAVNVLRGLVVQDYDIIRRANDAVLEKIDRAIPDLVYLKSLGGEWAKVVASFQAAVHQINLWMSGGTDASPHNLGDIHLHFDMGNMLEDPEKSRKSVQALAILLGYATPKEIQARVAAMAAEARNAEEKTGKTAGSLIETERPATPAQAFIRGFLKPVAMVNGKAARNFSPETNPLHEAMQWASENSGTAHTFEAAQNRLASILSDKKASKESKAEAKERLQKLSGREGKIYVYGRPMLGAFQYRKSLGDVLWQRMEEEAIEAVRRQYQGTEQWMRAPNGNATHLTERQWLQVRTPAFKAWFGDWENDPANASKIVDENGEPMVMYHQSPYQFEVFRRGTRGGKSGNGIYFSYRPLEQFGGERYAVFLNLRNPLTKENAPEGVFKKMGRMVMGVDAEAFDQHPEFDGAMAVNTEVTVREPNQIKSATDNVGTFDPNNPNILYQSRADAQMDADYFAAIERGDMDAVQSMVDARAEAMGFGDAIPEQTEAYRVRTKPAPKKTILAYKTVTIADDGSPSALFVGGTAKLPVGVWLDAVTPWHIINAKNGKAYVPSTQNPWTEGGKTGDTVVIREEDRAELLRRGFIKKPTAKTVTGLSFRPGLHFGSMPAFPQGGKTAVGANYQIKGKEPLGMVHRYNQVVYLCEIDADHDYTAEARAQPKAQTKKGTVNAQAADLQYMPEGGFYEYTTNPQNMGHPERGVWYISGSMKLVRPLTQEECDRILQENGLPPQEWEGGEDGKSGKLDLSALNVNPEQNDAARKTLAPITYDEQGNVIPLSKRFDRNNPSVLYQSTLSEGIIELFQRAWHGSPFRFDKFTLAHIGEGEGAQVHGWGLYFAQNRETSDERYRKRLSDRSYDFVVNGKRIEDEETREWLNSILYPAMLHSAVKFNDMEEVRETISNNIEMYNSEADRNQSLIDEMESRLAVAKQKGMSLTAFTKDVTGGELAERKSLVRQAKQNVENGKKASIQGVIDSLEKRIANFKKERDDYKHIVKILSDIDINAFEIKESQGQLYEVEIPDNDILLDEQKTLAEQPEAVRKALDKLGKFTRVEPVVKLNGKRYRHAKNTPFGEMWWDVDSNDQKTRVVRDKELLAKLNKIEDSNTVEEEVEHSLFADYTTGREIYGKLILQFGSAKAASLALKEEGVLGITYDGRRDGRCFVVWDEDAIQIYNTLYQQLRQIHDQQLDQTPDAFARGAVTDENGQYFIELFKGADLSTLFHELSHTYWLSMEKYVRDGLADAEMVSDWEKLCKWLGATPGQALTVEQHEMLARGWEGYFMEGKAPSVELEGVFQRIKRWFLRIYRDIKALNVELTDEVRGVFDRMLATQEEIEDAAAQAELVDLITGELQAMGVSPVQMAYTRRVLDEAKAKAAERLQQKRDQERKARLADYRRQAHEELSQSRHNLARSGMRKTPIDLDAVRALMGDDFANALMKKQPGTLKKGGMDPGQFAMQHGYQTAQEMLADLGSAKTLGEEVEDQVKRMDAEFDAQFDATDELLDTEEVAEHASLVARHLANIAGRPYIQQQAVNKVALQEMQAMSMTRAMRVGDFRANMRRALRDERRAIANGKYAEALEANTKARLNLEMARIAQELREDVDRTARQCKRFAGSKSIADVPKAFLARLVQRHSFLGPDWLQALVEKYSDQDILAWQKAVEADGYTMQIDDEVYLTQTPWRDMTMEQWESFSDALRQVITIERNQRKILTAKGKQDLEDIAQEIEDSLIAHNRPKVNGRAVPDAVRALRKYHAIHMKVEQMCLLLDGGKPGPMWNYIYKPIADAADDQALRLRDARDYLRDKLFGMFSKQEFKQLGRKEWVQSVGRSMTKEERLCVALNLGNSVNMERIRSGFGWTDAQISDVVSTLTARDWQFVQAVWDYINTFREPSFRVHQEITGSRPTAVEGEPITVRTADGQTMQLRGGYYPIKYDPVESSIEYARTQEQLDQQLMGGRNHGAAQTRHGHLRERTEGGLGSPLLLTFDVLTGHVFNTIHDFTHRKAVLDVAKIIRNRKVMHAIEAYGGQETYRELMPWLQDVANETQTPQSQVQRMASWARSSATIMQMGYKLTTIVMVPAGITQSVTEIGWGWTACGYGHVLKAAAGGWQGIQAMWQEVKARSAFMAGRIESFDRDVRDFSKRINAGPVAGWVDRIRNTAFLPMGYYQLATVDLPTWWGAFEKGLRENQGDEAKAAAYADSVVRLTQASGATKDLARVQRGSDIHRMLTMFYSYFNTLYNLGAKHIKALREDHTPAGIWRAANAALLLWFLPSVASEWLAGRSPDDGDDDLEGWLKWAAKIWIQVPFQACVGVRDVASAVFSEFDYQLSPAQSAPASVVKFFKSIGKAVEEEDPSLLVKPTAEAVGYALKLPGKQPIITAQNMWEYCTDPNSEFYLRDLFFVKPKSRQSR